MYRRALVELKMAMEFGVPPRDEILPLATIEQDDQPLVVASRLDHCYLVYVREDVSDAVGRRLRDLGADNCFHDEARVRDLLARSIPCQQLRRIRWYVAARHPDPSEYPNVQHRNGRFVVDVDGQVVAWAETDCEDAQAAEVSIETLEGFRRRGYGRQVTAAWVAATLGTGKVAFYSHRLSNVASRAVAVGLGFDHLSDEVEYI